METATAIYCGAAQNTENSPSQILEQIYNENYKSVYNYICFRINNHHDAEDLACSVFEKAMNNWHRYDPKLPVQAWLIGIAKNTATDYLRAKSRRRFVGLESLFGLVSGDSGPPEIVVIAEENRDLIAAMSRLKDRERQILSLKFATDLRHSEIARIMKISETNVGAIVHRALKKLKNELEGEF